jgi:hypothetical protein
LRIEAETIDRVPLACVIDGCRGGLAYLSLHSWLCIPEIAHGLTPDLETALRPIDNDLLVSLREVEPAPITRLISWGIACPAGLRANHLGGNSLQGAASVALGLINRGERFDRGVLILTTNRDGLLRPVGHEHLKLLAAVESYDHGRTSGYARDDQSSLRKIILSEDSDCDMSPADARGMPWLRLKTVHEAAEAVAAANLSTEAKVYQIAHATRRV